jgi:hypothetical protein
MPGTSSAWWAAFFADGEFGRASTLASAGLIRDYDPDVVVDSFGLFNCLTARIPKVPLTRHSRPAPIATSISSIGGR